MSDKMREDLKKALEEWYYSESAYISERSGSIKEDEKKLRDEISEIAKRYNIDTNYFVDY